MNGASICGCLTADLAGAFHRSGATMSYSARQRQKSIAHASSSRLRQACPSDAQCRGEFICDQSTRKCTPPCESDADCSGLECDLDAGVGL